MADICDIRYTKDTGVFSVGLSGDLDMPPSSSMDTVDITKVLGNIRRRGKIRRDIKDYMIGLDTDEKKSAEDDASIGKKKKKKGDKPIINFVEMCPSVYKAKDFPNTRYYGYSINNNDIKCAAAFLTCIQAATYESKATLNIVLKSLDYLDKLIDFSTVDLVILPQHLTDLGLQINLILMHLYKFEKAQVMFTEDLMTILKYVGEFNLKAYATEHKRWAYTPCNLHFSDIDEISVYFSRCMNYIRNNRYYKLNSRSNKFKHKYTDIDFRMYWSHYVKWNNYFAERKFNRLIKATHILLIDDIADTNIQLKDSLSTIHISHYGVKLSIFGLIAKENMF